ATECSGAADGNYRIAYSPGSLTVLPASLLIRPRPAAAVFGHGSPSLTWKANFVAGDGRLSLTDPPVCFTTARLSTRGTVVSPAGVYSILCRGAASPDYAISYQAGSYVVAREPTAMKYEGAARTKAGTTTRLVALLRRDTGAPVAGRLLSFVVRKGQWTGRCQARTGSHGKAQCSLTIGGTAGQGQIAITFAGDKAGPECDFAPATSKAEIVIRRR